jgi:hypothetical protein
MSVPMSQVLTTARTYLNDDNAIQFPDQVLIPKVQEAHRELQEELWIIGSPIVRNFIQVAYVSGQTGLPAMPSDFLCPTALFENAAGSSVQNAGWTPMTEAFYVPLGTPQGGTLGWWVWQQEQITLAGANVNRSVIVQYRRLVTIPILNTDLIGILFGESYLAARAAAICAGAVGSAEVYTAMTALADKNLGKVIVANRGQQKPSLRP